MGDECGERSGEGVGTDEGDGEGVGDGVGLGDFGFGFDAGAAEGLGEGVGVGVPAHASGVDDPAKVSAITKLRAFVFALKDFAIIRRFFSAVPSDTSTYYYLCS